MFDTEKDIAQDALEIAADRIIEEVEQGLVPQHIGRKPSSFSMLAGFEILNAHVQGLLPAEFFSAKGDPEPWYTLAKQVAESNTVEIGDSEMIVADLTASDDSHECGPCCGGHVLLGDTEMLVTLIVYAAPHATDGRALALYQVERLS